MALAYGSALVGTVATKITSGPAFQVTITNNDAAATLYVGFDANVTVATGFPISAGVTYSFEHTEAQSPKTAFYGIAAAGTVDARWVGLT